MRASLTIAVLATPLLIACAEAPPESASNGLTVGEAVANVVLSNSPQGRTPAYLATAASSDMYEIESSRLIEQAKVAAPARDFARMMIQHHTKTTADLTAAAKSAGITPPPPALQPKHAQLLADLRGQQGSALERAYLTQQVKAHEEALALHQGYARDGDTPALRQAAQKAVPIIEKHLARARTLAKAEN